MKVETALEHIRSLLEKAGQVNQIIVHRQPGALGDVTIEVRRQYRTESDLGVDVSLDLAPSDKQSHR
jgi:hypothetical protein